MSFDCRQTFERMQDFLDRELSLEERRLVQAHLEGCGMCAEEYLFEASVLRHVGVAFSQIEIPEDLFESVRSSLDKATA